jgi:hypothetical protein
MNSMLFIPFGVAQRCLLAPVMAGGDIYRVTS